MGRFNQGKKFSGDRNFRRSGGKSNRPQMHRAVCSDCGRDCEVPFRPTGNKPVFCNDCFGGKDNSRDNRGGRFEKLSFDRSNFGEKKMFMAVCDKCHKDCEVPFRPTGGKPVYCSDCFGNTGRKEGGKNRDSNKTSGSDQHRKQFEMLNSKLDSILELLGSKVPAKKEVKKKEVKKVTTPEKESTPKKATKKVASVKKEVKKAVTRKKKVAEKVVEKIKKKPADVSAERDSSVAKKKIAKKTATPKKKVAKKKK